MTIVGGFDVHRRQITFDYLDTETGEVKRGRITPATRESLRHWLTRFEDDKATFAVEGCTGWSFVVEELARAGIEAHLAEPADTAAVRGKKRRAKTDRADARHLRELPTERRLPEAWIPPTHVAEMRTRARLYRALMHERDVWQLRIHAVLFHHGAPTQPSVLSAPGRAAVQRADVSLAGRQVIAVGLAVIDHLEQLMEPLRAELTSFGRRQPGCRALTVHYGIGPLLAVVIWSELSDTRRFGSSRQAVRHTGLDVTVHSSDAKRTRGFLSRQGPPALRWALYEAAICAARTGSPDHHHYLATKARLGGGRAAISVARKLAARCHHTLRELGGRAWVEVS
jgi:transposase